MVKAILSQSSAKSKFFEALGLSEDNESHTQIYNMMKDEAIEGRRRLSLDPSNLNVQRRQDPNIKPPYAWDDISETARYEEVLRIYENASTETKKLYEQGRYEAGGNTENWVIKWMLWHVFRYRDNRNRDTRRRRRDAHSTQNTTKALQDQQGIATSYSITEATSEEIKLNGYWDPIRHN